MTFRVPCAHEPPREEADVARCPSCGSTEIVDVEWWGPTGVTAPDGCLEYQVQRGSKCLRCGAIEEV
jgi:hypothetical protein